MLTVIWDPRGGYSLQAVALHVFNLLDGVGFGQDKQENATPLPWPLEVANASSKVADVILSATRFIYKLQATAISILARPQALCINAFRG